MARGIVRTLAIVQGIANARGGKCLSKQYVNGKTPMEWICKNRHRWKAPANTVVQGGWCSRCARSAQKMTIEEMQTLARLRGGLCTSKKYENAQSNLSWRCGRGHTFFKPYRDVYSGQWCPHCSKRPPISLRVAQDLAKAKGGICLEVRYSNARTKMTWRCSKGHIWNATLDNVRKSWCPECAGVKKKTLDELNAFVSGLGGSCISKKYKNAATPLKWKCGIGHIWPASWNSVRHGSWCPECTTGLGERICRSIFEQLTGHDFPKSYPGFLREKGRKNLQLDGYNSELKIAFEYQGAQHFSRIPHFQRTKDAFKNQRIRDKEKMDLCQKNGVRLVVVPHNTFNVLELAAQISTELLNIGVRPKMDSSKVKVEAAYRTSRTSEKLLQAQAWAKSKNGKLLSKEYITAKTKLEWQCSEGHRWWAIFRGSENENYNRWCRICAHELNMTRHHRFSLSKVSELCAPHKIECLAKEYVNATEAMQWKCLKCKHVWRNSWNGLTEQARKPFNIRFNEWCPNCRNRKRYKKYQG